MDNQLQIKIEEIKAVLKKYIKHKRVNGVTIYDSQQIRKAIHYPFGLNAPEVRNLPILPKNLDHDEEVICLVPRVSSNFSTYGAFTGANHGYVLTIGTVAVRDSGKRQILFTPEVIKRYVKPLGLERTEQGFNFGFDTYIVGRVK